MLQISRLFIYPIKSLPGIELKTALVTEKGFEHDRRWMLVDEDNIFISQREAPQMTQLAVSIENEGLKITHKIKKDFIAIPFKTPPPGSGDWGIVSIWDDTCTAQYVGHEADRWFSEMLGIKCRLVYMPDDCKRIADQNYAPPGATTSFSDAYPYMILGQATLDDLNSRMTEPVPVNRFRPNIVFTGGGAFEEDGMRSFTIGNISFYSVKLCGRCNIPTIDQETGAEGKEPIKTLARYRAKNNNVYFGQYLVHKGEGAIAVGDILQITSVHHDERFVVNEKV
jgi:uncharacterized protein